MYVIPRKCVSDSHKKKEPLRTPYCDSDGARARLCRFRSEVEKEPWPRSWVRVQNHKKRSPLGLLIVIRMGIESLIDYQPIATIPNPEYPGRYPECRFLGAFDYSILWFGRVSRSLLRISRLASLLSLSIPLSIPKSRLSPWSSDLEGTRAVSWLSSI